MQKDAEQCETPICQELKFAMPGTGWSLMPLINGCAVTRRYSGRDEFAAIAYLPEEDGPEVVEFALNQLVLTSTRSECDAFKIWFEHQKWRIGIESRAHHRSKLVDWCRIAFTTVAAASIFLEAFKLRIRDGDFRRRWDVNAEDDIVAPEVWVVHETVKRFVVTHPEMFGAGRGRGWKTTEKFLLASQDTIDVFFKSDRLWVGVLVKSPDSSAASYDYQRELFQMVKYQAVLEAQAQLTRLANPPDVRVILALSGALPKKYRRIALALDLIVMENVELPAPKK